MLEKGECISIDETIPSRNSRANNMTNATNPWEIVLLLDPL